MGLFSKKSKSSGPQEGVIQTQDEILAYLDELIRLKTSLEIRSGKSSASTPIMYLDETNNCIKLLRDEGLTPNQEVLCGFSMDRTWFSFKSKLVAVDGKPFLAFPQAIVHQERRAHRRVQFTAREQVKVTVLESLGTGNGAFGMAQDISENGLCFSISKAMILDNEKEIPPSPSLFKPGTKLMMVKINRIPGCAPLEIEGVAQRVAQDGGWKCAITFRNLPKPAQSSIQRLVENRSIPFKLVRRSRKKRQEMDQEGGLGAGPLLREAPLDNSPSVKPGAGSIPASNGPPDEQAQPKVKIILLGENTISTCRPVVEEDLHATLFLEDTPLGLLKILREEKPQFVICEPEIKGKNMVDFLKSMVAMGVLEGVTVILCAEQISPKDRLRAKMVNIECFLTYDEVQDGQLITLISENM